MKKKFDIAEATEYISNLLRDSNIKREILVNDLYLMLTILSKYKNIDFKTIDGKFEIEDKSEKLS
jgi:hypothetical protein